ncbi:MAG: pantoate--beta-alanine ligase [Candidatus Sulfotelmatobacter sp.]
MKICTTIHEMRTASRAVRSAGKRLGFVPTMGALHEGHLSLVRAARASCDVVAASIFVNPTQFGPNEDLAKYPRSFECDRELLEREGVEVLFAPSVEEMYPAGAVTWVTVEGLSGKLDGRLRPGHFRGVTTVVAKLFHVIEPDTAFFGQKDAAQVAIIRRMVRDLNLPVEIVVCPIVREPDGLAMSSRNAYLDPEQRKRALLLHGSLLHVQRLVDAGEREAAKLVVAGREAFAAEGSVRLDYFELVDPDTLDPVEDISGGALAAVAAFVGSTRLIDNILLGKNGGEPQRQKDFAKA